MGGETLKFIEICNSIVVGVQMNSCEVYTCV